MCVYVRMCRGCVYKRTALRNLRELTSEASVSEAASNVLYVLEEQQTPQHQTSHHSGLLSVWFVIFYTKQTANHDINDICKKNCSKFTVKQRKQLYLGPIPQRMAPCEEFFTWDSGHYRPIKMDAYVCRDDAVMLRAIMNFNVAWYSYELCTEVDTYDVYISCDRQSHHSDTVRRIAERLIHEGYKTPLHHHFTSQSL